MAGEVKAAAVALEAAVATVDGLRVFRDPGAAVDGPTAILGAPALTWEVVCREPTSARWTVFVVVPNNERAVEMLWDLVPAVVGAVEEHTAGVVTRADPGSFPPGDEGVLPAYLVQVDIPLSEEE
jgi:hypothetical protein